MCGIAGIFNFQRPLDIEILKRFTDSMTHRGPDGSGYHIFPNGFLGFGHRRLAILDLSPLGKQPMSFAQNRYTITYNGEIFNFREVKDELLQLGYQFVSETDTEVILAAYSEWQEACQDKFNGMWAFAIWDDELQELFLSRDRFGIKPLYYLYEPESRFVFASETRAFKFLEAYTRSFDTHLLELTLQDPYALEGLGYTVFKDIYHLLPGHCMRIHFGEKPKQRRWWHIADHLYQVPATFEAQAETFYELFRDACRLRLLSDVPVATALSGGLDSTAVYSTVFDIIQKESLSRVGTNAQRAFTATFPGLLNDESAFAKKAVEFTGGDIVYLNSESSDLGIRIEKETELCDFISSSPISALSSVYKGMRENGVLVSLDGHGVDEMLYGYRDMVYSLYNQALWYGKEKDAIEVGHVIENMYHVDLREEQAIKRSKQLNEKKIREQALRFKIKSLVRKPNKNMEFIPVDLPALSDRPYDFSALDLAERMVYYEFFQHTLPGLLRNFDRAGMINSVEIRMPFMDWRLVTYVFSLPFNSKLNNGFTKRILREAMKGKMDESLRTRTFKVGISSPLLSWLNGSLNTWAEHQSSRDSNPVQTKSKKPQWDEKSSRHWWQQLNIELISR